MRLVLSFLLLAIPLHAQQSWAQHRRSAFPAPSGPAMTNGANRLYFPSSGAAAVTPSDWEMTALPNAVTYAGVTNKISSASTTIQHTNSTTSPIFNGSARYVYGPLQAQTISGSIKGQLRMSENHAGGNATACVSVKIIQSGGADRAVLLAPAASDDTSTTPPEFAVDTTPEGGANNRRMRNSAEGTNIALTSQAASAGDYLVVEIGYRSASTTARVQYVRIGDDGSDAPENDTDTTDADSWIEFSNPVYLQ